MYRKLDQYYRRIREHKDIDYFHLELLIDAIHSNKLNNCLNFLHYRLDMYSDRLDISHYRSSKIHPCNHMFQLHYYRFGSFLLYCN